MQQLSATQKATLLKSSRQPIERAFAQLRPYFRRQRWLGLNNHYRSNSTQVLEQDVRANSIREAHLAQYVAASALLHCADGWSFLGRALDCHTRGDAESALHLAYYAELRAAISLLATEGIGIFDDPSVAVNPSGTCHSVRGHRTHVIAWLALEHWADNGHAGDLLADVIFVGGNSLRTWLDNFQRSTVLNRRRIASKWLKGWGLDLRRFIADRQARNEVSYRPSQLMPTPRVRVLETSQFTCELWKLHEPSGESRFEVLDRYLLRRSIEETYRIVKGRRPAEDPMGFEADTRSMVSGVNPAGRASDEWLGFFMRRIDPQDPPIIRMAMETSKLGNPYRICS